MLLHDMGGQVWGTRIATFRNETSAEGRYVTYDLKPTRDDPTALGTSQVADHIVERLRG